MQKKRIVLSFCGLWKQLCVVWKHFVKKYDKFGQNNCDHIWHMHSTVFYKNNNSSHISISFDNFLKWIRNPSSLVAPTTSTQKQRGTVKCNSAATFCFSEQKISRGKKFPFREANLQTCPFKFGRPLLLKQSSSLWICIQ